MFYKIHESQKGKVLAICDKELIGKTLKQGEIEFTASENFYRGKKAEEKKIETLLTQHSNINMVGKKCIQIALRKGLIKEKSIIKIQDIPHVQIFMI